MVVKGFAKLESNNLLKSEAVKDRPEGGYFKLGGSSKLDYMVN